MGDRYIKDPTQTVAILCGLGGTDHILQFGSHQEHGKENEKNLR
jgi:hypothetical protein